MIYATIELNPKECPTCGVVYGLSRDFDRRRDEDGKVWYCPQGHSVVYTDTTVDRLKRRIETLEGREEDLRESVKAERKAKIVAKAAATRAKNRAAKGVCQFCGRTIRQMARHVESKHADQVTA